ncbi:thiamine-phosphate diphosphorylase [Vibrio tubiashii]|uniref:Thiamine-phosphate diphosphorylase n=2 Tax=Vibrio tubiashii TaxID=29498 RepID=A0AAE5GN26_9VIBR|nr:thiamine-phosphate diphosphorylase [Vibrio tubiashii]
MERLKTIDPAKMGKERHKREYDLRVLNCVGEDEYQSRMAIWNNLITPTAPIEEAKKFVDAAFSKLEQDLKASSSELVINYNEFVTLANEEINYIRVHVADNRSQYFWYATIALTICLTASLYF